MVFLDQIIREAASVMHEKMMKNEDKYNTVEDPETVSREIDITGVKVQEIAAKQCVCGISLIILSVTRSLKHFDLWLNSTTTARL